MKYLLAVGSNLHPKVNVRWVLSRMQCEFDYVRVGRFYHSQPSGMKSGHSFWNGAVMVESRMDIIDLKTCLCMWEVESGRDRMHPKCSLRNRTLDVDITWSDCDGWVERVETIMKHSYLHAPLSSLMFLPPVRKGTLKPIYFSFQGRLLGGRPVSLK